MKTTLADKSGRLVLLRHRIMGTAPESIKVSYTTPDPEFPLDGMMLWVEPLPSDQ
jgi:hypothetical protein